MNESIDITPQQREIILNLLKKYIPNTEVWAYGSRVKWTAKPHSDLDLVAFSTEEQKNKISDLRDAFEESDLPFRVDFFVWDEVPDKFHENIKKYHIVLQKIKKMNIPKRWKKVKLGEITDSLNFQRIPLSSLERKKRRGNYRYYGASGVVDYIDDYIFHGKYLLISEDGENLRTRKIPIAFMAEGKYWVNNHAHILNEKKDGILDYLESYFRYLDISPYITGAVQPNLNKASLERIDVLLPSKKDRFRINKISGSMKSKIELNQRANKILENIAQAIFKSWFIDFDPVHAKKTALKKGLSKKQSERAAMAIISGICSPEGFAENFKEMDNSLERKLSKMSKQEQEELTHTASLFPSDFEDIKTGEIPREWTENPISSISSLNTESIKLYGDPDNKFYHYSIPAYDKSNMPYIEKGSSIKSSKYIVSKNSILVSKLNPETKRVWYPQPQDDRCSICSAEFMQFIPKENWNKPFLWGIITSKSFQEKIIKSVTGTTGSRQKAQPKIVAKAKIILPPIELQKRYSKAFTFLLNRKNANLIENKKLKESRDILLSKLLSGEIDLSKIEIRENV